MTSSTSTPEIVPSSQDTASAPTELQQPKVKRVRSQAAEKSKSVPQRCDYRLIRSYLASVRPSKVAGRRIFVPAPPVRANLLHQLQVKKDDSTLTLQLECLVQNVKVVENDTDGVSRPI